MHELIEWKGYKLAAPLLREGSELSHPIEDYFPNKDPEQWFSWDQAKQNKWVRDNFDGCGVVFGMPRPNEVVETHHLVPLGAGHKDQNNWPGVMVPVIRSFDGDRSMHTMLEVPSNKGMRVVHWDPLDTKGGLEVVDAEGRALDHGDLWFYNRPSHDKVVAAKDWEALILAAYEAYVKAMYALGPLAVVASDHVKLLGAKSFKDWCGQHGVVASPFNQMKRLFDEMYDFYQESEKMLIHPSVLDSLRKIVPEEEQGEWVRQMFLSCSPKTEQPSISDFIANMKEAFPVAKNAIKLSIVPPGVPVETMEAADIKLALENIKPDLQGGTVIKGWPVEES